MTEVLMRLRRRPYVFLGLLGFGVTIALLTLGGTLRSVGLTGSLTWQVSTGALLLTGMIYQWMLLFAREEGNAAGVRRHYAAHRWVGVAMTLAFAAHAVRFGHAWTSVLAWTFLAVAATGLLNREIIPYRQRWLYLLWLWVHIALAAALVPLIVFHVWIALTYQ